MMFSVYQHLAVRSAKQLPFPDELQHALMGIMSEAGELADPIKKHIIYNAHLDLDNIKEEIGDLLWYVALLCRATGISMSEAAADNITKLQRRYPDQYSDEAATKRADKL